MEREKFEEGIYSNSTFAITKEMGYLVEILHEHSPDFKILYCDSTIECMEALLDKKADVAIQDSYMVTYLMQKPEYADRLTVVPGGEHGNEVCIVAPEEQEMLIEIIICLQIKQKNTV